MHFPCPLQLLGHLDKPIEIPMRSETDLRDIRRNFPVKIKNFLNIMSASSLSYISGAIGTSSLSSEALPNALPVGQNSPQVCPYSLYAEQLSGTAFTAPRHKNQRSWIYRIRPSVVQGSFVPLPEALQSLQSPVIIDPNPMRWNPREPESGQSTDFVSGLELVCGCGDPALKDGVAVYTYLATESMNKRVFYNSDGDFLIVPQLNSLLIITEFGKLLVQPTEIAVLPRGVKFSVQLQFEEASSSSQPSSSSSSSSSQPSSSSPDFCRGYVLEVYKGHFELPALGPLGGNDYSVVLYEVIIITIIITITTQQTASPARATSSLLWLPSKTSRMRMSSSTSS
jgi:homogentisate 1,2-dioxygenase